MTAMEFLKQIETAEKQMLNAAQRVSVLRGVCEKITSVLEGDHVVRTRNVTTHEDNILRMMEAEEALKKATCIYQEKVNDLMVLVSRLENEMYIQILVLRYIEHMNLSDIAQKIYTTRMTTSRYHRQAMAALDELLKNVTA